MELGLFRAAAAAISVAGGRSAGGQPWGRGAALGSCAPGCPRRVDFRAGSVPVPAAPSPPAGLLAAEPRSVWRSPPVFNQQHFFVE